MFRKVFLLVDLHFCFPHSSVDKESACNAGDPGLIPGSERSPGEGNGNPLQYSCLENPMDWGAWQATVHGVTGVGHDLVTKPPTTTRTFSQSKHKQLTERFASPPLKLTLLVSCGFSWRDSAYQILPLCWEESLRRAAWVSILQLWYKQTKASESSTERTLWHRHGNTKINKISLVFVLIAKSCTTLLQPHGW